MAEQDVDPATAALHLQTVVDELTQPGTVKIARDIPQPGTTAWQLVADDKALEEDLHGQLAESVALARHGDQKMMAADEQYRRGADDLDPDLIVKARGLADEARRAYDQATEQAERAHEGLHQLDARRTARTATSAPVPSLLHQLLDEIPNSSNAAGGPSSGGSRSPLALAALDVAQEIARTVGGWVGVHLPDQVRAWAAFEALQHLRPEQVAERAQRAAPWPDRIRAVLTPEKRWTAAGKCPDCNNDTAWTDQDGERVRRPAIEFDRAKGRARCLRCPARWETETELRSLEKVLRAQQEAS
jgi:hypothetical protein